MFMTIMTLIMMMSRDITSRHHNGVKQCLNSTDTNREAFEAAGDLA